MWIEKEIWEFVFKLCGFCALLWLASKERNVPGTQLPYFSGYKSLKGSLLGTIGMKILFRISLFDSLGLFFVFWFYPCLALNEVAFI